MSQTHAVGIPTSEGFDSIRAFVGKVRGEGDARFVVTYLEPNSPHSVGILRGESITFSLRDWKGDGEPRKDQIVILEEVQPFRKGWRALSARPASNLHQPLATSKELYHASRKI